MKKNKLRIKNDYWRKKLRILDLFKRSIICIIIRIILNVILPLDDRSVEQRLKKKKNKEKRNMNIHRQK